MRLMSAECRNQKHLCPKGIDTYQGGFYNFATFRRGAREAEGARLEIVQGTKIPSRVRIPPSPLENGAVAQLGERQNRTLEVRGSNPLGSILST